MEYYLTIKKNEVLIHAALMDPEKYYAGNPDTTCHILWNSIYMKCLEQVDPQRRKQTSDCEYTKNY